MDDVDIEQSEKQAAFQETRKFLRATGPETFELIEPHLLYLKMEQSDAYLKGVMKDKDYIDKGFHGDLITIAMQNAGDLVTRRRKYPQRYEVVDLGPGYPDKTLPLLKEAERRQIKDIIYVPDDVSEEYLVITQDAVAAECPSAKIYPQNYKFEDIDAAFLAKLGLGEPHIFLGLTYMNFPPEVVGKMLRRMSTKQSMVLVASELLTPINTAEQITARYQAEEIRRFTFGPLANLNYFYDDFESEVRFNQRLGRVEVAFKYKGSPIDALSDTTCPEEEARFKPFKVGDEVTSFVSYRSTQQLLDNNLAQDFSRRKILMAPSGNTALVLCQL